MRSHRTTDEQAFEAALAGRTTDQALAELVTEVRQAAAGPTPTPGPVLAAMLASGLTTDKGDLPATAASNVPGPAPQAAGLPKWRKKRMPVPALLSGIAAHLASAGLAAKAGIGLTAVAISATGAAAADVLPAPAQDRVAAAVETVTPFDLPDSADDVARDATGLEDGEPGVDGRAIAEQKKAEAEARRAARGGDADEADTADPADAGTPAPEADFGQTTAADAKDGGVDGETIATNAREAHQPTTPAGGEGEAEEAEVDGPPEGTPTADDNPGSGNRP